MNYYKSVIQSICNQYNFYIDDYCSYITYEEHPYVVGLVKQLFVCNELRKVVDVYDTKTLMYIESYTLNK